MLSVMLDQHVLDHPALRTGLITYLGNKRSLIPFIWQGMEVVAEARGMPRRMADPFSGSGVVSRLGRIAGLEVHSSDVEDYTRPFGVAFLETDRREVETLFSEFGGYQRVLSSLNAHARPEDARDEYFARYYAPRATEDADPARERLFYTRENALRIDAAISAIHGGAFGSGARRLLDSENGSRQARIRRDILLASVLVEMSIHINTSGVMKGFHHGWGGRGGDALSRIMAPIRLEPLNLIVGPRGRMTVGPAEEIVRDAGVRYDLVYADPPYTVHQYGANYHLLTSAVRGDRYDPGPVGHGRRAGIRRDHYRSDFCRKSNDAAQRAFGRFLDAVDTASLLVSYNNDGIINPTELFEMLSEDGTNTVRLMSREYHKFRGGKATQGAVRTNEYLFVVFRACRQSVAERRDILSSIEALSAQRELHNRYVIPERWIDAGGTITPNGTDSWTLEGPTGESLMLDDQLRVTTVSLPADGEHTGAAQRRIERASGGPVEAARSMIDRGDWDRALRLLQRLKIRKYRDDFWILAAQLERAPLSAKQTDRLEALKRRVAPTR